MKTNIICHIDVLEGLRSLPSSSIDLIITSPPYNKVGLNGYFSKGTSWNKTINYDGDPDNDSMDEEEYQRWQLEILNECHRVLKDEGSLFYNHKNRIHKGELVTPYQWLLKSPFKIRQEIIWDRGSTMCVNTCRYMPTTEQIYWLTKSSRPRFERQKDTLFKNEVWKFPFKTNTEHPAPFPIELPMNIIPNVAQGERITVLDPFMGSGTVAVAAMKCGCDYIGFEKYERYVKMAEKRINMFKKG